MDRAESLAMPMAEIHRRFDRDFTSIFFVSAMTGENCEAALRFVAEEAAKFFLAVARQKKVALKPARDSNKECC
jgi:hypothetical protein